MNAIKGYLSPTSARIHGTLSDASATLSGHLFINRSAYPTYDGAYSVTPSQESQVLDTANKVLTDNIIIDPIPSNYGLITWNGSVITVS